MIMTKAKNGEKRFMPQTLQEKHNRDRAGNVDVQNQNK